tara:strand:+ start:216 stop:479 length:264 start_codon:yes stop_codon:yes gene_type:complete
MLHEFMETAQPPATVPRSERVNFWVRLSGCLKRQLRQKYIGLLTRYLLISISDWQRIRSRCIEILLNIEIGILYIQTIMKSHKNEAN